MGENIIRGDHIVKKWWNTIEEFMREQEEIERAANNKRGIRWTIQHDKQMSQLRKMMEDLRVLAWNDPEKFPKCNPALSKIYKNEVNGKLWRMQFYVYPDGRVEFRHNQVADSIKVATTFADKLKL